MTHHKHTITLAFIKQKLTNNFFASTSIHNSLNTHTYISLLLATKKINLPFFRDVEWDKKRANFVRYLKTFDNLCLYLVHKTQCFNLFTGFFITSVSFSL